MFCIINHKVLCVFDYTYHVLSNAHCRSSVDDVKWLVVDYISSIEDQLLSHELPAFSYPARPSAQTKKFTSPIENFQLMLTTENVEATVQQSKQFS